MRITPMYGHGFGRDIPSRNPSGELFDKSDDEAAFQFRTRCRAAIDFLEGKRKDPDATPEELVYDRNLGADDFDRSFVSHRFGGAYDGALTV